MYDRIIKVSVEKSAQIKKEDYQYFKNLTWFIKFVTFSSKTRIYFGKQLIYKKQLAVDIVNAGFFFIKGCVIIARYSIKSQIMICKRFVNIVVKIGCKKDFKIITVKLTTGAA